jgi:hypothetical protein
MGILVAAPGLWACDDEIIEEPATGSDAVGGAGGEGGGDGGLLSCPNPDDPTVHYQTMDVAECPIEGLTCASTQFGFHNACGCGCIDKGSSACMLDPEAGIYLISGDPAECGSIMPDCPFGQTPFNNSCGCGCVDE